MDRRTYLVRCGSLCVAATVLAGCTEQSLEEAETKPPLIDERFDEAELDLPVTRPFDVVAEGIERTSDATIEAVDEFEAVLEDEGVAVESLEETVEHGDEVLQLEYSQPEFVAEGSAPALGIVAGTYAAFVRGGYGGDALEASVLAPDGRPFGEFEVETEWAEAYDEGETTAAVYGSDVMHTLESA